VGIGQWLRGHVLSYTGGVESFSYHYHTIEHEPDEQAIRSKRGHEHWFNVRRDDGGAEFRVVARVSEVGAHLAGTSAEALAMELGTAHAKGLIDLGYLSGEHYVVTREGDPPASRDDQVSDTELHLAILRALRRVRRAEDRTGAIEGLSIEGVSQVLGVSRYRLEDGLSDLLTGSLAEEHAATHGHSALQGAVTISSFGIRELSGYEASTPDRVTAAVMFTDIVQSTKEAARIGDAAWTTVAGEHWNRAGGIVGKHGGRVWKSTGDGMLASFPTTSQAIRAGRELVLSLAEVGFQLRVGIHLGEVRASGSDLEGIALNVAARVCAQAEGGSVYLTQVARDAAEEDVALVSEGSFELKGLPGSWDLYRVSAP
jgi:class 3 adenylate cyclase